MIVGARMKAQGDLATTIGWSAEAFARTKRMKPLDSYLKPAPTLDDKRAKGARDLRRMFDRMIEKQEVDNGTR